MLVYLVSLKYAPSFSFSFSVSPPFPCSSQRQALRRLQEVGVGVLVPLSALQASPLPASIALLTLEDVAAGAHKNLPAGESMQGTSNPKP